MGVVDVNIYWMLPSPQNFVKKVCQALSGHSTVVINTPYNNSLSSVWNGIYLGVRNAHYEDPIQLAVKQGTDISSDIAVHFGEKRMTALQLAEYKSDSKQVVILRAEDNQAIEYCERYAQDFITATGGHHGNIKLIIVAHYEEIQISQKLRDLYLVTFDEGVSPEEMEAYVNLRMINKMGFGSTRLCRSIVTEFAGFDLQFSERLMLLSEERLLSIREELSSILGEFPGKWTVASWLTGGKSIASRSSHVLYEQHMFNSGTKSEKIQFRSAIDKRFWRACLKALTPWLEERKSQVFAYLDRPLAIIGKEYSGKIPIPRRDGPPVLIDIVDLEYNNVVAMIKHGDLTPLTAEENEAARVCRLVKKVRDKIAHLQAPDSADVSEMILAMDQLLADKPPK